MESDYMKDLDSSCSPEETDGHICASCGKEAVITLKGKPLCGMCHSYEVELEIEIPEILPSLKVTILSALSGGEEYLEWSALENIVAGCDMNDLNPNTIIDELCATGLIEQMDEHPYVAFTITDEGENELSRLTKVSKTTFNFADPRLTEYELHNDFIFLCPATDDVNGVSNWRVELNLGDIVEGQAPSLDEGHTQAVIVLGFIYINKWKTICAWDARKIIEYTETLGFSCTVVEPE